MTSTDASADYMRQALELARTAVGQTSPNPAVGCVLVKNGRVVGRGFHVYADRKHAEIVAIEQAGADARGSTAYVTLEPCNHQGRTGPCTDALLQAGVGRVIAAMPDPNPLVSGRGLDRLRAAGVEALVDDRFGEEAWQLNEAYIHFMRTGFPLVMLKAAVTLDGKIAAPEDNRGWITSEIAREHVQVMRNRSDAILTGIGTVLEDDCLLNDRSGRPRSRPLLRIVLDSQLRIPLESKMVRSVRDDVLIATTTAASDERRRALQARGVKVVAFDGPDGRTDLRAIVEWLSGEKYLSLMIEAGSRVNWAALESGVVDKIFFYYAPKILGGTQSLPVAGGVGRRRRVDAIEFHDLRLHQITKEEFAVEAYLNK